jgi:hypothetical protein
MTKPLHSLYNIKIHARPPPSLDTDASSEEVFHYEEDRKIMPRRRGNGIWAFFI